MKGAKFMKVNKIITLVTAVVFLVGLLVMPSTAAIDPSKAVISVVGADVVPGETVGVDIKGSVFTTGFVLTVGFDNAYLEYASLVPGKATSVAVEQALTTASGAGKVVLEYTNLGGITFDNEVLFTVVFNTNKAAFEALSVAEYNTAVSVEPYDYLFELGIYNGATALAFESGDITSNPANVKFSIPPAAPEITGNVTINNTSPKVGDALTASYTYSDINGDAEDAAAQSVEWFVGGVSKGKTTKAASYTVTKDDFGKTIVAKATPTSTVEPKAGTAKDSAATAAVAANPALISSVSGLTFTPTGFISGKAVALTYTFVCPNGGADASDIAWTYEDGSAVAGTISADKKAYTPAPGDKDKKIKVTVTPKSDRNQTAGTPVSLVSAAGVVVGNPTVDNVAWDTDAIIVNRAATVSYDFEDTILDDAENNTTVVFEVADTADATTWTVLTGNEEGVEITSNTEESIATITLGLDYNGKFIKATVTPKNQHGVEGDAEVTDILEVIAGEPTVTNPKWSANAIILNRVVAVSYDFEDAVLEGAENNSKVVFEWADTKDAAVWNEFAVNEDSALAYDPGSSIATISLRAFYRGKFVRATITPENQFGVTGTPVVLDAIEVRAASGGSTGIGSGSTLPPTNPTPTPDQTVTPDPTSDPVGIAKFSDIPSDKYSWAVEGIDVLVKADVIRGVTATTFQPEKTLTRAEFTAMVIRALELEDNDAEASYSDVATNYWGYLEISSAQELGILDFFGDTFAPEQAITRDEMVALLYNAAKAADIALPTTATAEDFTDASSVAEYAVEALEALQKAGIINGMGDGTFAPKGETTRAQASKVIFLVYKLK